MPRARHSSASLNCSAFPPPDFRFMINTDFVAAGTGTPGVGAEISEARSRPNEYRASATAATARPRLANNANRSRAATKHDDARDHGEHREHGADEPQPCSGE